MRKKNFYALALAVTAACVTLVGCKDYDSDISSLQTQINDNKSAIEALQQAISSGKTISEVKKTADGYTISFSDGTKAELANGQSAPVPKLRINAARNWEMSVDGGSTWAELKDADGQSIADAKTYVADYVRIDQEGYLVIGDKRTAFKYDVTIPSVTQDENELIAIITIPATGTEPMKTLRVPMEGYFDRAFITLIQAIPTKSELVLNTFAVASGGATIGGHTYAASEKVYMTDGIPVLLNPGQVNANAATFTVVYSDGSRLETLPMELTLTPGSTEAISSTKAAMQTHSGLWTLKGAITDPDFSGTGFENVALCATNHNGAKTLSGYDFEITVTPYSQAAQHVPTGAASVGSVATITAATDIYDSYAAFDDGSQTKDGYGIRRADATVADDAPYTGDWEVYEIPAAMTSLTKAVTPLKSIDVTYTYLGTDGNSGEQVVTVEFYAAIPDPAVMEVVLEPAVSDESGATVLTLTQDDLLAALYPDETTGATDQATWAEQAKTFTLSASAGLTPAFELSSAGAGTTVADAAAFDQIKISVANQTAAGTYDVTLGYKDQTGDDKSVTIKVTVTSPVASVEKPASGLNLAALNANLTVNASDFVAKNGAAGTVSGGVVKVTAVSSADEEELTVEIDSDNLKCTRVNTAPVFGSEDVTVNVTVTVEDAWGVAHEGIVVPIVIAAALN